MDKLTSTQKKAPNAVQKVPTSAAQPPHKVGKGTKKPARFINDAINK